jgi:hypothetical protein
MTADEKNRAFWLGLPPYRLTMEQFKRLPEYSASQPTGVIPGKTWRRHNGAHDPNFLRCGGRPRWVICRYENASPEMIRGKLTEMCATVMYRPVVTVKMGRAECTSSS